MLHAAVPDRLHAREREMGVIRQFLREYVCGRRPGSLYVSGAPGTGKTACLSRILLDCKVRHGQGSRQQLRSGTGPSGGAEVPILGVLVEQIARETAGSTAPLHRRFRGGGSRLWPV